jgi:hypothetical protein
MKGIIFNLVEEVVIGQYGEDAWDALLDAAGVDGSYTSLGSYPDEDLFALVGAAATRLDLPADQVVRLLGRESIPLLADRYPTFFDPHTTTSGFLLTLNDIIHPEVRKLYPGAEVPTFGFADSGANELVIRYQSARQLCALAEGFIEGAAVHYGEQVEVDQPECMHRGDQHCLLRCTFADASAAAADAT